MTSMFDDWAFEWTRIMVEKVRTFSEMRGWPEQTPREDSGPGRI
jgi:hypothetical protein